jgi:uncharacterized membrane protein YjgN (DUF898 family)
MSHQITLNSWFGTDPQRAADKMAKVFRISLEQGETILEQLQDGREWRFVHKISDHQAGPAAAYLQSLGFQVDLKSLGNGNNAGMDTASWEEQTPSASSEDPDFVVGLPFAFSGKGGELFGLLASNWVKTVFSFGIYHFWAKTKTRNYLWSHTTFAEDPFFYLGTGKELFRGFLKILPILLGFVVFVAGVQYYGGAWGDAVGALAQISVVAIVPLLMVKAWRYRLSRTTWRGIRFSFRGKGKIATMIYLKGMLLTALTLGLYGPFFRMQAEKFWRENTYYGNLQGEFTGEAKDIFGKYVLALFLTVITAGIYWIWFNAYLKRYYWANTKFGDATFRFSATGGEWFVLYLVNLLLLVVTLGMGYSWVVVRNRKFFTEHLTLIGDINLDSVIQEIQQSEALGEEALDAFDVPVDIG